MNKRNRFLTTITAAVAVIALASVDVMAQGPAPTTSSAFRMYNSGTNWITIGANPANPTNGTFLWPSVGTGVLKVAGSGPTGTMSIGQILAGDLQLTQNSMLVGGPGNTAVELPAGSVNQVLQVIGGIPTWNTINLLPNGGGNGQTLYWDGTSWQSTNSVNVNTTTGAVTINNDFAVTGDVTLANGVINNNELEHSSVTVNAGTGLSGGGTVSLGSAITLTNDGILDVLGTPNQVIVNKAAGVATLSTPQDIHTGASPTFAGMTLTGLSTGTSNQVVVRNTTTNALETRTMNVLPNGGVDNSTLSWDAGTSSWVFNNTLLADPAGGVTMTGIPNITTLPSTSNILTTNNAGIVEEISLDDLIGSSSLTPNAIWYGDGAGNPAERLSPGPAGDGQVLQINPAGTPVWDALDGTDLDLSHNAILIGNASGKAIEYGTGAASNGDVLTVVGSTPTWVTPAGSIAAAGQKTISSWSTTVTPGGSVNPSTAQAIIVTLGSGLQATYSINNITATTFDIELPYNASGSAHWVIVQ